MATTVTRVLELNHDNSSTWAQGNWGCECPGGDCFARQYLVSDKTGYADLRANALSQLYPTDTAIPYRMDSYMRASRNIGSTAKFELQIDYTTVHSVSTSSTSYNDYYQNNITVDAVTKHSKPGSIRYALTITNRIYAARLLRATITTYFYQYSCAAQKGSSVDGVSSVNCSNANPYNGDPVTWSCSLNDGAVWYGWYSDAACTSLVSNEQSYTVSASADTTLYAKAMMPVVVATNLYVKVGNTQNRVKKVYKKISGHYVEQTNIQSLFSPSDEYEKK